METVDQFIARGGVITTCAPRKVRARRPAGYKQRGQNPADFSEARKRAQKARKLRVGV